MRFFEQSQKIIQTQKLETNQRQELANRLNVVLETPAPKEVIVGIEGMLKAGEILQKNNEVGILIGGMAKKCWERTTDVIDFDKKDVDVLVISKNNKESSINFGQGIDWWLPKNKHVEFKNDFNSIINTENIYFTNVNNVVLRFRIKLPENVNPGLYIMDLEQLITMQYVEATSKLNIKNEDPLVEDTFYEHYRRRYQKVQAKHLPLEYKSKFIDQLIIEPIDNDEYKVAIKQ